MRVVQMIDRLRLAGGAERLQYSFAEAARDRDVDLTVITLQPGDPEAEREVAALGARVVRFDSQRFGSLRRARALRRFLAEERFDVMHTHLVRSTILGGAIARTLDLPVVATIHNTQRNARLLRALDLAEAFVLRHWTNRVIAVGGETARAHASRLGGRAVDVVPNAVAPAEPLEPTERRKIRRELGVEGSTPLLISVGRLHPQKAIPDLLCALARLRDKRIDFALRLAGRGPSGALVQEEIARLRLSDRVKLLGVRRDVPRLLGASDLYLSSSLWEGLPVATLEAMAAGLPVVATAVGDVPYAVTPETGTLVEPGDVEALAGAVARMLRDKERRAVQGAAARRRAREHFGREAWIERILAIYLSLPGVGPDEAIG